jgi:hypothetical protein
LAKSDDSFFLAYGVYEPYHAPSGRYFVVGDNIADRVDRQCYGAILRENIIDKLTNTL